MEAETTSGRRPQRPPLHPAGGPPQPVWLHLTEMPFSCLHRASLSEDRAHLVSCFPPHRSRWSGAALAPLVPTRVTVVGLHIDDLVLVEFQVISSATEHPSCTTTPHSWRGKTARWVRSSGSPR